MAFGRSFQLCDFHAELTGGAMKKLVMGASILLLASATGVADAKGCVSGAAVGGVAGHVAGRHAVLGAAAGCAINHHRNKVKDAKAAATTSQQQSSAAPTASVQPQPK
jgi:hypothetical protein